MINHREEARKYDPQGNYVRRWLPVLARLPVEYMHRCCPRLLPPACLRLVSRLCVVMLLVLPVAGCPPGWPLLQQLS